MNEFLADIKNYIDDNAMLEKKDRVVVGISGGADSCCLLISLCELLSYYDMTQDDIVAVHVNHMIRGDEALKDKEFVHELCERMDIKLVSVDKDIPAYAKKLKLSSEEAGRLFRYETFEKTAKEYCCNKIAVAHNKNDLAETFLFNLVRGSGMRGLNGIPPVRGNIIRPLLCVTREQIENRLDELGQSYRIDSTNNTLCYDRNKIRHVILPELVKLNPAAISHIAQASCEAGDNYFLIRRQAYGKYKEYLEKQEAETSEYFDMIQKIENGIDESALKKEKVKLYIDILTGIDKSYSGIIIHDAIAYIAGKRKDIKRVHVEEVYELLSKPSGRMINLPYGIVARKSYDSLVLQTKKDCEADALDIETVIKEEGEYTLPSGALLNISINDWDNCNGIEKNIYTKMADYGKIPSELCIRTPRAGDYIVIDDSGKKKKLNRVFIDAKIDKEKREHWPLIAAGSEVIWAIGLRYSGAYLIDDTTQRIVTMQYTE